MSGNIRRFFSETGKLYMQKKTVTSRLNEEEENIPMTAEEFQVLKDSIVRAAEKLNKIRGEYAQLNPEDALNPVNISKLKISYETLDDLNDRIEDEYHLLEFLKNQEEEEEELFDETDKEPTEEEISAADDSEVFDNTTDDDIFDTEPTNTELDNLDDYDNPETEFYNTMAQICANVKDVNREPFFLVLRHDPDTDYLVYPLAVFKDRSVMFKFLEIDGEKQQNLEKRIPVSDIDVENTEYEFYS